MSASCMARWIARAVASGGFAPTTVLVGMALTCSLLCERVSAQLPGKDAVPAKSDAVQRSRPAWFWADGARHEPESVELQTTFRVDASVQRADLRLAAEFTRCIVRFGEDVALTLDDYGPWLELDVTDHVVTGNNTLTLLCDGSTGPSAVLLELVVTTTDGRHVVIQSGSQNGANWRARRIASSDGADSDPLKWSTARSYGIVAAEYWDADRTARITPFDNYEQWRQASDTSDKTGGDGTTEPEFALRPGFEIERVRAAGEDEGSWVSMALDPRGRLTIAREDRGLLRFTVSDDGAQVTQAETINDTLLECRGLLYAHGALFAQANNTKGLYRLDDLDGDGQFAAPKRLREFPGGVGHGRNDLTLGPDGAIYAIFGDSIAVPRETISETTSPFREARRGESTTEGFLLRYEPQTDRWSLISSGLRNPFGVDFNPDGEAFTYDADAEFDMGAPWYRPTRLVQLVSGGDFGWRGRTNTWPPYDADHADFTIPSGDIGKGSPTAVKSGAGSSFPERYRHAMFALDWAYGRVLACHLVPRGAGYVCRAETFLKGRPLNVTDLEFGPDGSLYLITGGRKTRSALYRVRWTGDTATPANDTDVSASGLKSDESPTPQKTARAEFSATQRSLRRSLAKWHGQQPDQQAVDAAWPLLGHADPLLRDAARVVLESQPIDSWTDRAFNEQRPEWIVTAMLALSRSQRTDIVPRILHRLLDVRPATLPLAGQSMLLETWSRCLTDPVLRDAAAGSDSYAATVARITAWYPETSPRGFAPTGAGRSVNHQLALLAAALEISDLVPRTIELLARTRTQEERLHAIFVLRNCRSGWTIDARREVFDTLGELDRTAIGGEGMPGFLRKIREELVATLADSEREELGPLVEPGTAQSSEPLMVQRPVVKQWKAADVSSLLTGNSQPADLNRGRELFHAALCSRCHRVGNVGGVVGPDLTSIASRFGSRDILLSVLEPSRVVDEKYRSEQIVTTDGRVMVGRLVTGGDYRSTSLKLATDPLRPDQVVEISKSDIELHRSSPQSPMPAGLLDTLTPEEIRDLLAYLQQR